MRFSKSRPVSEFLENNLEYFEIIKICVPFGDEFFSHFFDEQTSSSSSSWSEISPHTFHDFSDYFFEFFIFNFWCTFRINTQHSLCLLTLRSSKGFFRFFSSNLIICFFKLLENSYIFSQIFVCNFIVSSISFEVLKIFRIIRLFHTGKSSKIYFIYTFLFMRFTCNLFRKIVTG